MISKMIHCCIPNEEELEVEFQNKISKEVNNMNYNNEEEVDGVLSLFPSIYIREDERKYLKFTYQNYHKKILSINMKTNA